MGQKYQKWDKVLELFFEYSNKEFSVREISKKTGIPSSSVHRYLKNLDKEKFIKEKKANLTPYFRFRKAFFIIDRLFKEGLIDYLEEKFIPSVIVVFGSIRKGEYDKESDIDLFIESTKKVDVDLSVFEKKLGHKIQLFIEHDIKNLQPHLHNNVINGIKLSGYLSVI